MNIETEPRIEEVAPIEPLLDVAFEEPVVPREEQVEETRAKLRTMRPRPIPRSAMNLPAAKFDPRDQVRGWKLNPRQMRIFRCRSRLS